MVSLLIMSIALAMALPTITTGNRLEHNTQAKLSQAETARNTLDFLYQRMTRSGRGLVVAQSSLIVFRSADDVRKRCTRLWLDDTSGELRYQTTSAAIAAADPLCPTGDAPIVLARGISTHGSTPLFAYEDEPGVPSAAGQETVASRIIVAFEVGDAGEHRSYHSRALTVGR